MSVLSDSGPRVDQLVGRERELALLEAAFEEASVGRGRMVLVTAEAGGGKTALVRAFCDRHAGSARVLWGACDALFTPRPLGPFVDVAAQTRGELDDIVLADAKPYDVASALIRELERRSPTILVLDDLHWADEATLDVLTLVGRRIGGLAGTVVVTTYRDDELNAVHPLRIVVGELARGERASRLLVEPLSAEGVAALAAPHGVEPEELYRRTQGNPFYVTEVLAAGGEAIPATIRDAVLARVARLSPAGRGLLEAVAVVPTRCDRTLLERLAVEEEIGSMPECLSAGILASEGRTVRFRHELARLAIEETIEAGRRMALHEAALEALSEADAEPALLAHHAEKAGDVEAVQRFARMAGDRAAAVGAHREAADQYGRALEFAGSLPAVERADLLVRRSQASYLTDESSDAIDAVTQAVELYRSTGDRLNEGQATRWLATILWCPGRTAECAAAAHRAVELLETLPPGRELAMAYATLGFVYLCASRRDEAAEWATRATELARRVDDVVAEVHALTTIGYAESGPGGWEKLERACELADRKGLHQITARAYNLLAIDTLDERANGEVRRCVEQGIEYCSLRGLELYRLYVLSHRARLELREGRWDEAAETASAVLRIPRTSTTPRILTLSVLGLVRARRGDPESRELLDEAWELAEPTKELQRVGPVALARAEAFWLDGDHRSVLRATEATYALAVELGLDWWIGEIASWRRRAGAGEAVPPKAAGPYALELAGDWRAASDTWTRLGCPYDAALALADADEPEPLREAHDRLQGLGAARTAAIVARKLRALGERGVSRGPRLATRENAAGLTARELDVLRLLADGLRNVVIAERLFVSRRTVEHHVSAILAKLGVQSRGEAVAEGRRLGLVQDR